MTALSMPFPGSGLAPGTPVAGDTALTGGGSIVFKGGLGAHGWVARVSSTAVRLVPFLDLVFSSVK